MSTFTTAPDLAVKKKAGTVPIARAVSLGSDCPGSPATIPASPASSDSDNHQRTFSLSSVKSRSWWSFSNKERDSASEGGGNLRTHARKLSKSRQSVHLDPPSRRGSSILDDHGRLSLSTAESMSSTTTVSSSSIDWKSQNVGGAAPLEPDTHLLKTKAPYLVVTTDYVVKMKCRTDALALFPCLAIEGCKQEYHGSTPEPLLVIPIASIASVFVAESTRPSFGVEVWWRSPPSGHSFCRSEFFFGQPTERNDIMHHMIRAMRVNQQEENGVARMCQDVEGMLNRVNEVEEPKFHHRKPEIFPVVPRGNTRRDYMPRLEDATKKPQECSAFYLVVGTYLCHLVQIQKGKGGDHLCRHRTYGLVTLESFKGEWILHEERFNITFRDPFESPVTLELASRHYRQIIRVFGTADRFLKPVWPQLWQSMELFHVTGLKEPQYLVPRDDFGSVKRTLDAYLAAYRCNPVDWEINWKTRFAPEFRLLPPKHGSYSPLQLLAVLRALRYNDYFNSLSFRDVDLSVLHGLSDNTLRKVNVAYLSRTCVALGPDEVEELRVSPVLQQEFHALAFCSETIRQIDLRNCSRSLSSYSSNVTSLQFLTPILNLLRSGITKCNRLILSHNILPRSDIENLAETMETGAIQALDVSFCGLDDASLRDMIVAPLSGRPCSLQSLSLRGNPGRLPAHVVPGMLQRLPEIRELNLSGSIQADCYLEGSLLPFAVLDSLQMLEQLDISGYKVDNATLSDLERLLRARSSRLERKQPSKLHKLALNHCGITGTQAARLFHAIGEDRGMHLCISGNPIEDGVEDLAAAIRQQKGPACLYQEMIEFKDESSYLSLIKALTETRHLSLLSLAGTAPSDSSHGPCSRELVTTLHDFFARNTSIRCLDISGFSGKLDDGQLPKGFGQSLAGLASNTTLTHLRIRNQNLHDDAGTLGRVIAANNTLLMVDCRDNNLNLTSLRFLVDNLRTNTSIIEFPFPPAERSAIWKNVLRGLQRTASSAALPAPETISYASYPPNPPARDLLKEEESLLRDLLDAQFAALDARLQQNRAALEAAAGRPLDFVDDYHHHHHHRTRSEEGWPALELDIVGKGVDSGGDGDGGSSSGVRGGGGGAEGEQREQQRQQDPGVLIRRPTVRSSAMEEADAAPPGPYRQSLLHVQEGHGGDGGGSSGMQSPAETVDPVSEVETPPEGQVPVPVPVPVQVRVEAVDEVQGRSPPEEEGDELIRKMMEEFRAAGFDI
ncbi:hypothetical protein VTK56DRAFT_9566 [Thermocarpiscus australiensis]